MESKVNYTLVGLFVVILTVAIVVVAYWLSTGFGHKQYANYIIYMNESVAGLSLDAPVKFNGVDVGYVSHIELNPNDPKQVRLQLDILQQTPIKTDTVAMLMSQGLTGLSYINLSGGSANASKLVAQPNEPYPVIKTQASLVARLDTTVQQLSASLGNIGADVRALLDEKNRQALEHSLENLDKVTSKLAANTEKFQQIMQNTAAISQQLPKVLKDIDNSAQAFTSMSKQFATASQETRLTMQQGRLAVQAFNTQALPQATNTLASLQGLSEQLKVISEALTQNPAMLLRGRKALPSGPGE